MKKMTNENDGYDDDVRNAALAEFHWALGVLTGKWKGEILWQLAKGKQRFGALRRLIPGISQHMLTARLRELEDDGLVKRTIFAEVPPRVEYEITEAALALRPMFDELFKWSQQYGKRTRCGA
jgi:DNA-binding HxlR family transcriptional regulator